MTADKRKTNKHEHMRRPLLESFSILFYFCKLTGLNSQDWMEFRKYKQLKRSPGGESFVIITMIMVFINFNLMIAIFESVTYIEEKNNLSVTIGFCLTYFSLFTYLADRITGLLKQQQFENIFLELDELDEDFMELNIVFDNNCIKRRTTYIIIYAVLMEALIFWSTFILLVDTDSWTAWLWTFTAIPTFLNTLDKVWFNGILIAVKYRFRAINKAFDEMALKMEKEHKEEQTLKFSQTKEKMQKKNCFKNKIQPVTSDNINIFGDEITNPQLFSTSDNAKLSKPTEFSDLEERCIKLCQLHDGLCSVGKLLNTIWAFPNLILMGYCFFIATAQLYFVYCADAQQAIPSLFRPAQNLLITAAYLIYIFTKCVSVLMLSWTTNLECKKTGICIHRCALAADKDEIYEMINHLSLKLFNHLIDFNACGYFPLNMTTLFGFCGGITTYLIILIQFNMEEQQVAFANSAKSSTNFKINYPNETVAGNMTNSISLLNILYKYWSGPFKNMY